MCARNCDGARNLRASSRDWSGRGKKLWKEMQRWYHFAPGAQVEKLVEIIPGQCETCQVHNPTNLQLKGTIEPCIVPPTFGESVSKDIFDMPNATWNGETFDAMTV
jgi:hypothetical protein